LATGDVSIQTLPVEPLGSDADGDLYQVDKEAATTLFHRVISGDAEATAPARLRVQVLNGVGTPGVAQSVTETVAGSGAEVVLVDNADRFDYEVTQIVYYDRAERDRAVQIRDLLGVGELVLSRNRLDVVDVTVVIGMDYSL
jgi:hypothetical protein